MKVEAFRLVHTHELGWVGLSHMAACAPFLILELHQPPCPLCRGALGEEKGSGKGGALGEEWGSGRRGARERDRGGARERDRGGALGEERERDRGGTLGEERERDRGGALGEVKERDRGGALGKEKGSGYYVLSYYLFIAINILSSKLYEGEELCSVGALPPLSPDSFTKPWISEVSSVVTL